VSPVRACDDTCVDQLTADIWIDQQQLLRLPLDHTGAAEQDVPWVSGDPRRPNGRPPAEVGEVA